MKRLLPGLAILLTVIAVISTLAFRSDTVQNAFVDRYLDRRVASVPEHLFSGDTLNVVLCGSGSPMPSKNRAGPCVAIVAGEKFYLVDAGARSANNLGLYRLPGKRLDGVFISHFHSDHISDLGELNMTTWAQGRNTPLKVFGLPGVTQVVDGFNTAYAQDWQHRLARHGSKIVGADQGQLQAMPFDLSEPQVVLNEAGLKVTAFRVDQPPLQLSVGYRFDYMGRSVVVSGETRKSQRVITAAKDADVLIHEAMGKHVAARLQKVLADRGHATFATIMRDIPDYHSSPVDAAEVANAANVTELVMYRLLPTPASKAAEQTYLRGVDSVRSSGVTLGYDCLLLQLPADSKEIKTRCLVRL